MTLLVTDYNKGGINNVGVLRGLDYFWEGVRRVHGKLAITKKCVDAFLHPDHRAAYAESILRALTCIAYPIVLHDGRRVRANLLATSEAELFPATDPQGVDLTPTGSLRLSNRDVEARLAQGLVSSLRHSQQRISYAVVTRRSNKDVVSFTQDMDNLFQEAARSLKENGVAAVVPGILRGDLNLKPEDQSNWSSDHMRYFLRAHNFQIHTIGNVESMRTSCLELLRTIKEQNTRPPFLSDPSDISLHSKLVNLNYFSDDPPPKFDDSTWSTPGAAANRPKIPDFGKNCIFTFNESRLNTDNSLLKAGRCADARGGIIGASLRVMRKEEYIYISAEVPASMRPVLYQVIIRLKVTTVGSEEACTLDKM